MPLPPRPQSGGLLTRSSFINYIQRLPITLSINSDHGSQKKEQVLLEKREMKAHRRSRTGLGNGPNRVPSSRIGLGFRQRQQANQSHVPGYRGSVCRARGSNVGRLQQREPRARLFIIAKPERRALSAFTSPDVLLEILRARNARIGAKNLCLIVNP